MSVLERIANRLAAAALAEEGDVETAREIEAEVEDDQSSPWERRADPPPGAARSAPSPGAKTPSP